MAFVVLATTGVMAFWLHRRYNIIIGIIIIIHTAHVFKKINWLHKQKTFKIHMYNLRWIS
jgi:hypothetical protein